MFAKLFITIAVLGFNFAFSQNPSSRLFPHTQQTSPDDERGLSKSVLERKSGETIQIQSFRDDSRIIRKINLQGEVSTIVVPSHSYSGGNGLTSALSSVDTVKSVKVTIVFDKPFNDLSMGNKNYSVHRHVQSDSLHAVITVPAGKYDLFVTFSEKPVRYVFREGIIINDTTTLVVSSTEAKYSIKLQGIDNNGQSLAWCQEKTRTFLCVFPDSSALKYWSLMTSDDSILVTELSDRFKFLCAENYFRPPNIFYNITHDPFQGLHANKILVNRIDEFRKQNLRILFPPNSQYRAINFLTKLDQVLSASMSQEITGLSGVWNGTLFLNSEKDQRYRFPISLSAFIIQDKSLTREWSASAPFRIINDSIGMYSGVTLPKSLYLSANDGSMTLGGGPVYTNAELFNNFHAASNIAASPKFYWALDDEKKVSVNEPQYIIYDSAGAMISSSLPNTAKGLGVPAGEYTLEVTNRDYYVRNKQGKATLRTRFDLRKADANPPQISSLRLLDSGGKSVDMLAVDEQGTLIFSSADVDYVKDEYGSRVGVYKHINAHATQLSYRVNGTSAWNTTLVSPWMVDTAGSTPRGIVYKADMTAATHVNGKAIDLKLILQDMSGNSTEWSLEPAFGVGSFENSVGVDEEHERSLPGKFALRQNYPNPFNPMTMIEFDIPRSSFVTLELFNVLGQKVSTIIAEDLQAGTYKIPWNAAGVSTGIYFYRFQARQTSGRQTASNSSSGQAGTFSDTKKFLLIK